MIISATVLICLARCVVLKVMLKSAAPKSFVRTAMRKAISQITVKDVPIHQASWVSLLPLPKVAYSPRTPPGTRLLLINPTLMEEVMMLALIPRMPIAIDVLAKCLCLLHHMAGSVFINLRLVVNLSIFRMLHLTKSIRP